MAYLSGSTLGGGGGGSNVSIEDIRYVAKTATFTGTADGTFNKPFATIQEAIDYFGVPVSQADFNRQVQIQVLDRAGYTEVITLTTRRYNFVFAGGTVNGNWTQNIDNALKFGSNFFPRIDCYSATRNGGTQVIGSLLIQLSGTAVSNVGLNLTNIFWTGSVTIADGVNGGPSVTTGTGTQLSMINSSITTTFLGRNTGVALLTSTIVGNIEMQAILSAQNSVLFGTSISMYGTATTTRNIIGLSLLSTGGVTWTNVNVEPRWNADEFTLNQFTNLATVATNKIQFNVNNYTQATNNGATGAVRQSYHDSASPAANDIILSDSSFGRDSAANKQEYARTEVVIDDATTTAEDGVVKLYNVIAGAMTELVRYGSQGGVNIFNILGGLQCDSIVNDTGLAAGTYTPTLTGVLNVSSSTAFECQYMRVGNVVTVSGKIGVTPTANNTQTIIGISLPVASNFSSDTQAGGTAYTKANASAGHGASIYADATNNRAEMDFFETVGASDTFAFTFTYEVI